MPVEDKLEPIRAKRHRRPPIVLVRNDVQRVFCNMSGIHLTMAKLLYGGGLRLMECIRLRVQDLDFERGILYIRGAKGGKDRTTLFPLTIHECKAFLFFIKKGQRRGLFERYRRNLPRPAAPDASGTDQEAC